MKKFKKGFTLVELLVVVTIIAILSVTAFVALGGQTARARNSRRAQDLTSLQSALALFALQNTNRYPLALDDGDPDDSSSDLVRQYISEIPLDPASSDSNSIDYVYARDGVNQKSYQLAATLENEDGTYKALVVGDGTNLITGVGGCGLVINGEDCLPYNL